MITNILGGKAGAADAASSAKHAIAGRSDADASGSGFADALSDFGRDAFPQQSDDVSEDDAREGGDRSAPEGSASAAKQAKTKPIIDIRPESLRSRPENAENSAESLKQLMELPTQEEARKSDERQLTPAERKLRDALAAAKALARKSDELNEKGATISGKEGTADNVTGKGKDADPDQSMLSADDGKIADVLSLLSGAETKAGALNAAMPKNDAGVQGKRSKGTDGRPHEGDIAAVNDGKHISLTGDFGADRLSMPREPNAGGTANTRVFRFSNARSENQSVDMTIGGDRGERTVSMGSKSASSGAVENVTVLDSRRFLGLAPNSNGANLTAMLSGDSEWAAAMHPSSALSNAAAQSSTGTVVNTLKLQMNPHELGSVTATLRLHGEELNVHLTVETRAAYRQLSEDSGGILDALRAQGFAVDQVTISITPSASSDAAGNQQGQTGQMNHQSMAEGERQGEAAGRGQEQADNRQAGDQGARNINDAVSDNAAAVAPGGARPGQLYL